MNNIFFLLYFFCFAPLSRCDSHRNLYVGIVWPFPKFIRMFWWWIMLFNHLALRSRLSEPTGYFVCCTHSVFVAENALENRIHLFHVDFFGFVSSLVCSFFSSPTYLPRALHSCSLTILQSPGNDSVRLSKLCGCHSVPIYVNMCVASSIYIFAFMYLVFTFSITPNMFLYVVDGWRWRRHRRRQQNFDGDKS